MEPTARRTKSRESQNSARSAASAKAAKPYVRNISSDNTGTMNRANSRGNAAAQNINKINNISNVRNIKNIRNVDNINNSNINTAGVGVLSIPGHTRTRSADLDRYRERVRENQRFPNRRRRIITGKDLTTPLRRAKVKERKVQVKVITINRKKLKFPIGIIACVFAATVTLLCLICSYIVLNNYSADINTVRNAIQSEEKRGRDLSSQLDSKNDISSFVDIATNRMGMVKEDLLPKNYIAVTSKDKVEVVQEQKNIIFRIQGILSSIFSSK